uniref:Ermin n=1 Tax=Crocodylus porosus TaxID=8502 RepID=A0A7M4FWC9_CROPO
SWAVPGTAAVVEMGGFPLLAWSSQLFPSRLGAGSVWGNLPAAARVATVSNWDWLHYLLVFLAGQYEEIIPVSTKECEVNRQEERNAKHPHGRKVEHANKAEKFLPAGAQEMVQILERKLQIKDEMQLKAREKAAGEEDEDVEEEELVQLTENKKVNSEESYLKKQENGREESPPNSPSFNSQAEKPGEQLEIGGKNDVSKHSYSKYNTISYRKIRKGNTKQRIDEFESMMHL